MLILRKLILKEWFKFFIASVVILFLLVTIANLISGLLRGNVTPVEVLNNYLIESPAFFSKIFPVSCLMASLFSINKLKNRNELTAIFATGFSRRNYFLTILYIATAVATLQFITTSYIQPFAKKHRHLLITDSEAKFKNLKSKGLRASTIESGRIWYKGPSHFFSFSKFETKSNTLYGVSLYFYDKSHKLRNKIWAKKATYLKDNLWTLYEGTSFSLLNNKGFPLAERFKAMEISLSEVPEDFKQIEADITTLYITDLFLYIYQLKSTGLNTNEYEVVFLNKISSSLICIIFALIAATGIFNPNRRSSSFAKNTIS